MFYATSFFCCFANSVAFAQQGDSDMVPQILYKRVSIKVSVK